MILTDQFQLQGQLKCTHIYVQFCLLKLISFVFGFIYLHRFSRIDSLDKAVSYPVHGLQGL